MSTDHNQKTTSAAEHAIRTLAATHNVAYVETAADVFGRNVTRLSGDDVELDEPEQMLLALRRAGHITSAERARLHGAYLRAKFE